MRVVVNGEARELPDQLTVAQLVDLLGLGARRIAVEINRDVLSRDHYGSHRLAEGDQVEIVQFIGGG